MDFLGPTAMMMGGGPVVFIPPSSVVTLNPVTLSTLFRGYARAGTEAATVAGGSGGSITGDLIPGYTIDGIFIDRSSEQLYVYILGTPAVAHLVAVTQFKIGAYTTVTPFANAVQVTGGGNTLLGDFVPTANAPVAGTAITFQLL